MRVNGVQLQCSGYPAVQRHLTRIVYTITPSLPSNSWQSKTPPTTNVKRPLCDNPVNPLKLQL